MTITVNATTIVKTIFDITLLRRTDIIRSEKEY